MVAAFAAVQVRHAADPPRRQLHPDRWAPAVRVRVRAEGGAVQQGRLLAPPPPADHRRG